MNAVIIRMEAGRYKVADPFPRKRRGEPAIGTRKVTWHGSAPDAFDEIARRLEGNEPQPVKKPQPAKLKPQAVRVLNLMRERGSLTALEALHAHAGFRLAARVSEIRRALGKDCIQTMRMPGEPYVRYRWAGGDAIQPDVFRGDPLPVKRNGHTSEGHP